MDSTGDRNRWASRPNGIISPLRGKRLSCHGLPIVLPPNILLPLLAPGFGWAFLKHFPSRTRKPPPLGLFVMLSKCVEFGDPHLVLILIGDRLIAQGRDRLKEAVPGLPGLLRANQSCSKRSPVPVVFCVELSKYRTEWVASPEFRQRSQIGEPFDDLLVRNWRPDFRLFLEKNSNISDTRLHGVLPHSRATWRIRVKLHHPVLAPALFFGKKKPGLRRAFGGGDVAVTRSPPFLPLRLPGA